MPIYFTPNGPWRGTWSYRDAKYAGAVGVELDGLWVVVDRAFRPAG